MTGKKKKLQHGRLIVGKKPAFSEVFYVIMRKIFVLRWDEYD